MDDITIIMMTANRVPEGWARFHRQKLEEVIGDSPIITVSYRPLDWGLNLIQTEYCYANVLKQMLRAAKIATTKWIGMADDDTLYPPGHFQFKGKEDGFYYNHNRWHIATWLPEFYYHKPKPGNGCMVATREMVVEYMEKRIAINPKLDADSQCKELGTWNHRTGFNEPNYRRFDTENPLISLTHEFSRDRNARKHKKVIGLERVESFPYWGRSIDIIKKFA